MAQQQTDKRAPMAAAPLRYTPEGAVAWGEMWDTFCALAQEGGPPHRGALLRPPERDDPDSSAYRAAAAEIARGIQEVSGLTAVPDETGWLAVRCDSPTMARWLSEAIAAELVAARCDGPLLLVPVGAAYTLTGEIKNVVTVVAKTTHYWHEHLPAEVKQTLAAQARLAEFATRVRGWFRR
jgi:sirohydrochlorin cobaltochelatase